MRIDAEPIDNTRIPTRVLIAGWVLMGVGLLFPPIIVVGAWVAIVGFVWAIGASIHDKGRDEGLRRRR